MNSEQIYQTKNLTFKYQDRAVIEQLDLSIPTQSLTGIIGPNGAGKSTFLKCLLKLLLPTTGKIVFAGEELQKFSQAQLAKSVGMVPQKYEIPFEFTVFELVMLGRFPHQPPLQLKSSAVDQAIVTESLVQTSLTHLAGRYITELSGGELQRVIIAQALAQKPQVLLLDEPIASLDLHHQLEILSLLKNLTKNHGVTVLLALHDLNLAAQFCDQLLLMKDGKLLAEGTPIEVLTPTNLAIAYQIKAKVIQESSTNTIRIQPSLLNNQSEQEIKNKIILVTGGTRSGKSSFAQELATHLSEKVVYIATAEKSDPEMSERILYHQASRPTIWSTIEASSGLPEILTKYTDTNVILIDCLTVYLSNLLLKITGFLDETENPVFSKEIEKQVESEFEKIYDTLKNHPANIILVTNEVGAGLVPPYHLGRLYRDLVGRMNQRIAKFANQVYHVVCGQAIELKTIAVSSEQAAQNLKQLLEKEGY